MADYRLMIVQDVQQSIAAVNNIVASLERDAPLSSDIIQMSYPQETVDEFLGYSQAVVDVSAFSMARTIPRTRFDTSLVEYAIGSEQSRGLAQKHRRPSLPEPRRGPPSRRHCPRDVFSTPGGRAARQSYRGQYPHL